MVGMVPASVPVWRLAPSQVACCWSPAGPLLAGAALIKRHFPHGLRLLIGSGHALGNVSITGAVGPGGPMGASVGGHSVGLAFVFTSYSGPGTYAHDSGNKGGEVDGHVYGSPASYTVQIRSQGNGTPTFSNAADPLDPSAVTG